MALTDWDKGDIQAICEEAFHLPIEMVPLEATWDVAGEIAVAKHVRQAKIHGVLEIPYERLTVKEYCNLKCLSAELDADKQVVVVRVL